ncbi:MAG: WG repeat-containing protein [Phycisphaeraceae bacterium]
MGEKMLRHSVLFAIAGLLGCLSLSATPAIGQPQPPLDLSLDEAIFESVTWVDPRPDDVLYPVNINNWWGLMNRRGDLVVYPHFDWTDYAWEGRLRAVKHGRTGFIDGRGAWLVDPIFPYADRYADGYAIVGDGERFGYLDKTGDLFLPIELDGALRFREGFAAVQQGERIGFVDRRGELVVPLQFARARSFFNGMAMVQLPDAGDRSGMLGFIDKRGEFVFADLEGKLTDLGDFRDGMARAQAGGAWGYLDRRFQFHIEPAFEEAGDFVDGVARVRRDGKWGYINKTGQMVVEPQYDRATDFAHGLGMVVEGDGHGYVNRTGAERIALEFAWALPFFRDLGRVAQPPSFGYVDVSGRPVWDPRSPLRSIRNRRLTEDLSIETNRWHVGHREVPAPPWREPRPEPYPADHLYEPELPRPPVP